VADGQYGVEVKGLAQLRRDLRAIDREAGRDVQRVVKDAVGRVAEEAARTAPYRTGALARSYRPYTRGNVAGVRSTLPYAGVIEFGGTIRPRGVDIRFPRRLVVIKAAERQADRVVNEIADGLERTAERHGFHR
jgi:phage gpG-like protein